MEIIRGETDIYQCATGTRSLISEVKPRSKKRGVFKGSPREKEKPTEEERFFFTPLFIYFFVE
ncbi:MAG: hypothetical protein MRERV_36c015 [Mycoplasmataceae bacterium RV_VA103A]|nr:MAG: hypothetical protein MRERV_36c015 [Mycoplasmataceae bacterium RV_VA103A]